jgi:Zn-dependent peptidase ImmA (M78 family)/transcriptional regulator with XRE-family HTH domain
VIIASIRLLESQEGRTICAVANPSLGARIRALRERVGMQSQELATMIGVDPSAMSNIESDKRAVKTDELTRIAEALKVSPLALLDEGSLLARMPVAARSGGLSPLEGEAYRGLLRLAELHQLLAEEGIAANPQLSGVPPVDEVSWKRSADELAKWASDRLRVDKRGDERFVALVEAIENRLGVDVWIAEHSNDSLAGAAITDAAFPLIFVNADQRSPRALFTLAHELGHLLSRHGDSIAVDDDLNGADPGERVANAFAAAFLMPEEDVIKAIEVHGRTAESLARMIRDFGVSFETLIYRLHNLQIIDARGRDSLRSLGWQGLLSLLKASDVENADIDLRKSLVTRLGTRPEQRPPVWLLARAIEGFERGVVSIRPLAALIDADPDDLLEHLDSVMRAEDIIRDDYRPRGEIVTDEELYAGNPL